MNETGASPKFSGEDDRQQATTSPSAADDADTGFCRASVLGVVERMAAGPCRLDGPDRATGRITGDR